MLVPLLNSVCNPSPSLPKPPFPRFSPQGTLEAPPSPILRCLSRPLWAALHLAARRSGGADVWREHTTSRSLDPDGCLVRCPHGRHHAQERRDASAATRWGEFATRQPSGVPPAPTFMDFQQHNTGVTQREYNTVHGEGQFALLFIPTLAQRSANPQAFLPATDDHPSYQEPFRAIPSLSNPLLTDLGVWHIFANPDSLAPQAKIRAILCAEHVPQPCPDDNMLLDEAIARSKIPSLRDLGHSAPYMHNGQFDTLDAIIRFISGGGASQTRDPAQWRWSAPGHCPHPGRYPATGGVSQISP